MPFCLAPAFPATFRGFANGVGLTDGCWCWRQQVGWCFNGCALKNLSACFCSRKNMSNVYLNEFY